MNKIPFWMIGFLSGAVFLLLLCFRLDFFNGLKPDESISSPALKAGFELAGTDTWMNIFMNRQKIGYSRRVLIKKEAGYDFTDRSYLKLNLMGSPRDLFMETTGRFNPDFSLVSFRFDLSSGSLVFSAKGQVKNHVLEMETPDRKIQFPLEESVYLPGALMGGLKALDPARGKTMEFQVFDPVVGASQKVLVRLEGKEIIEISGKPTPSRKIFMEYKGLGQHAWVDESGEVIQETGPMGLRLVKTTKEKALSGFTVTSMEDLTRSVSVAANRILTRPEELASLRIRLLNLPGSFQVNGGRQTYENKVLTITKENLDDLPSVPDPEAKQFFEPSPNIQSTDPEMKRLVSGLISNAASDLEKAKILVNWVYENIEKTPVISIPDALSTLKTRKGDCNEHAALLAAMARAAGIPAQMETGLVYMKGRFYYHAWNVLYLGDWITMDAALGQFPADATHIRLIRGDLASQFDLVQAMGKIQLEVFND
ncbi:MAG: transglutaminase-like domain-containing protein [Proteobacteria bacterium]|nr:transglutaminase-like domain-containing protein [Pseudomonadota bacterium]MBU4469632.1 transglutaminase-like domain-containing protein [Pseudomonadota bacterium]MCG2751715.1 transglutaminase-like domain-containing protein [Desulfobacteraceae bacterium]